MNCPSPSPSRNCMICRSLVFPSWSNSFYIKRGADWGWKLVLLGRYYVCLIPYRVSDVVTGVVQVQIGFLAWICIGVGLRTGKVSCEYRIRNLLAMDLHGYT